jgi:hypothetical protein
MKADVEKAFILHELESERETWLGSLAAAVEFRTAENVHMVSESLYRLDILLDELIEVNAEVPDGTAAQPS